MNEFPAKAPNYSTAGVNLTCVGSTFLTNCREMGLAVFEPFGGLCGGLEGLLRNGIRISQYVYADTDPAAQKVARYRLSDLSAVYPLLLSWGAWEHAFDTLPTHDVREITVRMLEAG